MDEKIPATNPELAQPGTRTLFFRPGFYKMMINNLPPPKICPFCGSREIVKAIKIYAHNDAAYDLFSVNVCQDHQYATNYRRLFGGGAICTILVGIILGLISSTLGWVAGLAFALLVAVIFIFGLRQVIIEGKNFQEIAKYLEAFVPGKNYDRILFHTEKINPKWLAEFDQVTRPYQIDVDYPKIIQTAHEKYLNFRKRLQMALIGMLIYLLFTIGFLLISLVTNTFIFIAVEFLITNIVTFPTWIAIRVSITEDVFK